MDPGPARRNPLHFRLSVPPKLAYTFVDDMKVTTFVSSLHVLGFAWEAAVREDEPITESLHRQDRWLYWVRLCYGRYLRALSSFHFISRWIIIFLLLSVVSSFLEQQLRCHGSQSER